MKNYAENVLVTEIYAGNTVRTKTMRLQDGILCDIEPLCYEPTATGYRATVQATADVISPDDGGDNYSVATVFVTDSVTGEIVDESELTLDAKTEGTALNHAYNHGYERAQELRFTEIVVMDGVNHE
ncbi:hypothetical protein K8O68_09440 [Salipaludibacillus sp. CUR1]|uniref:hypothetical protein n=1 Tax=Salipaludibacillus sp. CUR1 TaxID=2820003 RepID=UPI001E417CD1|nr:hypothetical protein [Salipaludibacillus sp. CUR1]MCE7792637.1 hypothetical protein [Salipaludibacillus sp. CUR1]